MAILEQGQLGLFTGKIGAIVIAKWKDNYVGRSKPRKSVKTPTLLQLNQRSKFALVGKFIQRFPQMIAVGFKAGKYSTGMNEAMRLNLANAVSGIYPDYSLDFPKIMLSEPGGRGLIDGGADPVLVAIPKVGVKLTWKLEDMPTQDTKSTDVLYTVYYSVQSKISMTSSFTTIRSKLTIDTPLPKVFLGEVHGWMFFASADGKYASGTQYLGKVTVS